MTALKIVKPEKCDYCGQEFDDLGDLSEHFIDRLTMRDARLTRLSNAVVRLGKSGRFLFRSELVARCENTGTFLVPYEPSESDRRCPDDACLSHAETGHLLRKRRMWICNVCACGIKITESRTRPVHCHCLLLLDEDEHNVPMNCFGAVDDDGVALTMDIRLAL